MGGPYYRVRLLFEAIMRKIDRVDDKVSALTQQVKEQPAPLQTVYLSVAVQKTQDVLKTFDKPVAASEIAAITGRARAVESMHLNELWRMGLAEKEKRGRKRVFSLKEGLNEG
ncbi:helix-turn-helix domain-containing protein [Candidatus Bathyarchaeota archaeon]|nr:helix-turn-helix domain-containing protein [Candidatus Bathyarchaeota archaeon]